MSVFRRTTQSADVHGSDELKTAPKGYPRDHPRVDLLRYKGIVAMMSWPAGPWIGTARAKHRVVDLFHAGAPLIDWLTQHAGLTEPRLLVADGT